MKLFCRTALVVTAWSALTACGGGDGGNASPTVSATETTASEPTTSTTDTSAEGACITSWNDPTYDGLRQYLIIQTQGLHAIPKVFVDAPDGGSCTITLYSPRPNLVMKVKALEVGGWRFVYAPSNPRFHNLDVDALEWNATADPSGYVTLSAP